MILLVRGRVVGGDYGVGLGGVRIVEQVKVMRDGELEDRDWLGKAAVLANSASGLVPPLFWDVGTP